MSNNKNYTIKLRINVLVYLFLFSLSMNAQYDIDKLEVRLDSIIQVGIDSSAFPGANIYVLHKGDVLFQKAYGHHTYSETKKVSKDDIYDMASVSKITTGLPVLMKLIGEGRFDIDKPLSYYLPYFKGSNKGNKTYREILSHSAQLIPHISHWENAKRKNGSWKWCTFKSRYSKRFPIKVSDNLYLHRRFYKKMKKAIKNSELLDTDAYKYSGLGFYLMPEVISNIVDEDFETYLYKEIYHKIGAKSLGYNPLDKFDLSDIVPTEYDSLFRRKLVHGTVHDEGAAMMGGVSCNAGLFGDAEDLGKLMQLYLDNGIYNGVQIIDSSIVELFTSYAFKDEENRRGLGFDKPPFDYIWGQSYIAQSASPLSYGHSGYTGTFVWVDPQYDLIFIFLSNRVYPSRKNRNLYKLDIRPSMHQAVYDCIMELE